MLAASAAERAEVVPKKEVPPPTRGEQLPLPLSPAAPPPDQRSRTAEPSRHPWSWLLMRVRVFGADVTTCERVGCGGRMRIVEIATEQRDIARVMFEHGMGPRGPPPERPARPPPAGQLTFDFAR